MLEQVGSLYKKEKDMKKGVAYPTCVSINECVCAFSPMDDEVKLAAGDVVKVDLACHVDGYIGSVAGTTVVGCGADTPATGKAADVIAAAYTGAEAMMRMVKPGSKNTDIPGVLEKIAEAHGCTVVEGVLSHQMKRFMIDGEKCILAKPDAESKVDETDFEVNEVYHLDVAMSTGDGKTRELDEKQRTVYKRANDVDYQLKMKASRAVLSEIKEKFPSMPFTLRQFESGSKAKLGMTELSNHEMVYPYPVLFEKAGALVAHVKYTILLMPTGTMQITGVGSCPLATECECKDEEVVAILATSIGKKKKKKNKKKKAAAIDESVEAK